MRAPADRAGARIPRGAHIRAIPPTKGTAMTRTKPLSLLLAFAAIALVALVAAGCGGGDNQATAASANSNAAGGSSTIGVSDVGSLGRVLVDSHGRTVYLFEK